MDKNTLFLIFGPAWLLVSFMAYWPVFLNFQKEGRAKSILMLRYYGAALFGGIPLLLTILFGFSPKQILGLSVDLSDSQYVWMISLVLGLIFFGINYFAARRPENLKEFPQIRDTSWSAGLVVHNVISWIIYLIGYEILFRGFILFPLAPIVGFWPAAVLGTVIYSLSHYPKSLREAVGAVPFGLILAWIAWETQSVLPCIWIHSCLAVSISIFSLYHHPRIHVGKQH